ncbi:GMC oxidoreductase [Croceicoccus mobilis]|uniref:GMC oxidoreductase n=1 Tax=Croceicoccus mobilis TaxID=1703339 RepID=A0A917DSI4_9SPHN|nr:GMC oxidoreductase [Croceicoccus mobilis]GGD65950.1 GMC oxidoreductase [Croceicoccus mobilis]
MLMDASDLPHGKQLDADLCIIGAGPAGIALAMEFMGTKASVLLVDAGSEKPDVDGGGLFDGASANPAHPEPTLYRKRQLGGASSIWGGRCVPYDPIDFEERDWLSLPGWPIGHDEIVPFYARAQQVLDAGEFDYAAATALDDGALIDGFADAAMKTDRIERFSLPTDVWRKNRQALSAAPNITVLTNATCVDLVARGDFSGVSGCVLAAPDAERHMVHATHFVVASGGLETYRLLANSWREQGGIGNHSGLLGRGYMCHLELAAGTIVLDPGSRGVSHGFEMTRDGIYARRKFTLSPEYQRENRVLNAMVRLHHPGIVDPAHRDGILSLMYLAKNTVIPEYRRKLAMVDHASAAAMEHRLAFWTGHLRNVVLGAPRVAGFTANWIARNMLATRKLPYVALKNPAGIYAADMNVEQEPTRDSRVCLTGETDQFGMHRLEVDWKISPLDIKSAGAAYRALAQSLGASGVARLAEDPDELAERAGDAVAVGGHHIGLARMADDPSMGVVDPDCAVYRLDNLSVAGAAVLPTSSHANPTLTLVALALRLGDHLKRKLAV